MLLDNYLGWDGNLFMEDKEKLWEDVLCLCLFLYVNDVGRVSDYFWEGYLYVLVLVI